MDDIPANIQRFNLVTLALFARLYEAFPKPIHVEPGQLGLETTAHDANSDNAWAAMEGAEHSLEWLAQEGFVRYDQRLGGKFAHVVLTMKGLTALGSIPKVITPSEAPDPMYKRIKRALASGAKDVAADGAKTLVQELFKLGITGMVTGAL